MFRGWVSGFRAFGKTEADNTGGCARLCWPFLRPKLRRWAREKKTVEGMELASGSPLNPKPYTLNPLIEVVSPILRDDVSEHSSKKLG